MRIYLRCLLKNVLFVVVFHKTFSLSDHDYPYNEKLIDYEIPHSVSHNVTHPLWNHLLEEHHLSSTSETTFPEYYEEITTEANSSSTIEGVSRVTFEATTLSPKEKYKKLIGELINKREKEMASIAQWRNGTTPHYTNETAMSREGPRVYRQLPNSKPPDQNPTTYRLAQNMNTIPQNINGPPQNIMGSPQNMMGSPQNMMIPPQNMIGPPQNMMGPSQNMMGPPQNMYRPDPNMNIPDYGPKIRQAPNGGLMYNLGQNMNGWGPQNGPGPMQYPNGPRGLNYPNQYQKQQMYYKIDPELRKPYFSEPKNANFNQDFNFNRGQYGNLAQPGQFAQQNFYNNNPQWNQGGKFGQNFNPNNVRQYMALPNQTQFVNTPNQYRNPYNQIRQPYYNELIPNQAYNEISPLNKEHNQEISQNHNLNLQKEINNPSSLAKISLNQTNPQIEVNPPNQVINTQNQVKNIQNEVKEHYVSNTQNEIAKTKNELTNTQKELGNTQNQVKNPQNQVENPQNQVENPQNQVENSQNQMDIQVLHKGNIPEKSDNKIIEGKPEIKSNKEPRKVPHVTENKVQIELPKKEEVKYKVVVLPTQEDLKNEEVIDIYDAVPGWYAVHPPEQQEVATRPTATTAQAQVIHQHPELEVDQHDDAAHMDPIMQADLTKTTPEDPDLVKQVDGFMVENGHGYFSAFSIYLCEISAEMDEGKLRELFQGVKDVIDRKSEAGEFNSLGYPAGTMLPSAAGIMLGWDTEKMKSELSEAALYIRTKEMRPQVQSIFNQIDALYSMQEGHNLLLCLADVKGYPQTEIPADFIAGKILKAILAPFERLHGSPTQKNLMKEINSELMLKLMSYVRRINIQNNKRTNKHNFTTANKDKDEKHRNKYPFTKTIEHLKNKESYNNINKLTTRHFEYKYKDENEKKLNKYIFARHYDNNEKFKKRVTNRIDKVYRDDPIKGNVVKSRYINKYINLHDFKEKGNEDKNKREKALKDMYYYQSEHENDNDYELKGWSAEAKEIRIENEHYLDEVTENSQKELKQDKINDDLEKNYDEYKNNKKLDMTKFNENNDNEQKDGTSKEDKINNGDNIDSYINENKEVLKETYYNSKNKDDNNYEGKINESINYNKDIDTTNFYISKSYKNENHKENFRRKDDDDLENTFTKHNYRNKLKSRNNPNHRNSKRKESKERINKQIGSFYILNNNNYFGVKPKKIAVVENKSRNTAEQILREKPNSRKEIQQSIPKSNQNLNKQFRIDENNRNTRRTNGPKNEPKRFDNDKHENTLKNKILHIIKDMENVVNILSAMETEV